MRQRIKRIVFFQTVIGLFCTFLLPETQALQFRNNGNYGTGFPPYSVSKGDLNQDAASDLVTVRLVRLMWRE